MAAQNLVGQIQTKWVGQKIWRANKLGGPNNKLGGPVRGRPTHSTATGLNQT